MEDIVKRRLDSISREEIDRWITPPRFCAFLEAAEDDVAAATALYDWNICISAVFFEVIGYTEVLLRNAIDAQFSPVHHGQGWWQTYRSGSGGPYWTVVTTSYGSTTSIAPSRTAPAAARRSPV